MLILVVCRPAENAGQAEFRLPARSSCSPICWYQEKATQIYYQHLRRVVSDRLLKEILVQLSRDKARHLSFR